MDISCLPRPQVNQKRLASDRGSTGGEQALPDKKNEDGDHAVSPTNNQARRPLGLFRLEGRILLLGDRPKDREAFTINLDGRLLQFGALPMGWALSPYVF